jgi:hypothetical protein
MRRLPSHSEAVCGLGQKASAFSNRRNWVKFSSTEQVKFPGPRKSLCLISRDPPLAPGVLTAAHGLCLGALRAASPSPLLGGRKEETESSPAPSARTALPVSARPALWASSFSARGRDRSRSPGQPWMQTDEREAYSNLSYSPPWWRQEEGAKLPAQGLMGQEAGSFLRVTREIRARKSGGSGAARRSAGFPLVDKTSNCRCRGWKTWTRVFQKHFWKLDGLSSPWVSGPHCRLPFPHLLRIWRFLSFYTAKNH